MCKLCDHVDRSKYEDMYFKGNISQKQIGKEINSTQQMVSLHFLNHTVYSSPRVLSRQGVEIVKRKSVSSDKKSQKGVKLSTEATPVLSTVNNFDVFQRLLSMLDRLDHILQDLEHDPDISSSRKHQLTLQAMDHSRKSVETLERIFKTVQQQKTDHSSLNKLEIVIIDKEV